MDFFYTACAHDTQMKLQRLTSCGNTTHQLGILHFVL